MNEADIPEQQLFELFGLPPDTHYAQEGYGRMCVEGTRNEVLEDILRWINDDEIAQFYWLNGAAGTGKTTIALTVADLVGMDRSKITAMFFCSRHSRYRCDVQHVFITLSILLAARNSAFRAQLVQSIQKYPGIIRAIPKDQARVLIVEPLRRAGLLQKSIVIVIDALDECKDKDAPGKIIDAFAKHLGELPFLKVLISTRSSPSVANAFQKSQISRAFFCVHDIDRSLVDEDIGRYLFEVLCTNASVVERLSMSWPPQNLLEKLVNKAGGLFIYASFIGEQFILVGAGKLEDIADHPGSEYEGNLGLNIFYGRILSPLVVSRDESSVIELRHILAMITHLWEPLPVQDVAYLAGLGVDNVQARLLELQSIVVVSRDKRSVRPIHRSLQDWLTDQQRSLPSLFVEPTTVHGEITLRLLECMVRELDRSVAFPKAIKEDEKYDPSLEDRGEDLLDYACRYWVDHLTKATPTDELQKDLEWFVETKLVRWIERLDYSGILMGAAIALENARTWYHVGQLNILAALSLLKYSDRTYPNHVPSVWRCFLMPTS